MMLDIDNWQNDIVAFKMWLHRIKIRHTLNIKVSKDDQLRLSYKNAMKIASTTLPFQWDINNYQS